MNKIPSISTSHPPLGLEPRHIWEAKRIQEIMRACIRYADAGMSPPSEWPDELADLLYKAKNRDPVPR